MDQPESSGVGVPIAKAREINNDPEQHEDGAVGPAVNQEKTADIFKLDIDCHEEALDYLPLKDLVNVSKTCKRLQQVAGYCFQQNYSGYASCGDEEECFRFQTNHDDVEHFAPYIQNIDIFEHHFRYFFNMRSKFQRLKKIRISHLKPTDMNCLKEISMGNILVLDIHECDLSINFHEIIDHRPKIKCLEIGYCKGEFNWFDRKYPSLEYFKFFPEENDSIEGIPMFLELNPNIRKFMTTADFLLKNGDKFLSGNIKLDNLAIRVYELYTEDFELEHDLLNKLHDRGFYKKLELYISVMFGQELNNRIISLKALNKLFYYSQYPIQISALKSLEELHGIESTKCADLEALPKNLTNLKRIYFSKASIDDIMPFIRHSVEMYRIKVKLLRPGIYFNYDTGIIDLLALNREREQLPGADKITLYVLERTYLATKWALGETDFGLIRLKREKSFEWDNEEFA